MEQTFNDLLRERAEEGTGLFAFALWMFVETSAAIVGENLTLTIMQNIKRRLIVWAGVVALLLLLPLVAMQFTGEVNWDLFDFALMGALLFGAGLTYELIAKTGGTVTYRVAVGVALAAAFLLVWVNGAVGIIGNEGNPANLMYGGVLAVGTIGALVAHFKPRGMARVLFATALAQALVAVIALIAGMVPAYNSTYEILGINGFFVALFAGSALLFRSAARKQPPAGVAPQG